MARKFQELEAKMSPEPLARAKVRAKEMIAEMLLSEVLRTVGLTQKQLAAALGIKQPTLSHLESQDDMQISTLQRLVRALGGELEIIVHLPTCDIRLRSSKTSREPHSAPAPIAPPTSGRGSAGVSAPVLKHLLLTGTSPLTGPASVSPETPGPPWRPRGAGRNAG